jgi:hypothetical protein
MRTNTPPTEYPENQNNELVTPEMREQVARVKRQLDQFTDGLRDLFHKLQDIDDVIFRAQQAAVCLLSDDLFGALEEARMREREEKEFAIDMAREAAELTEEEAQSYLNSIDPRNANPSDS